jgi:hypothetical protein
MTYAQRSTVSVTTDASGNATAYSNVVTGKISAVIYTKDGSNAYANGVDFTLTAEATGQNIWVQSDVNASATVAPRQATHGTDGTASLYASGGTAVQAPIVLAQDRVKISLAQGGNTKVGQFTIIME